MAPIKAGDVTREALSASVQTDKSSVNMTKICGSCLERVDLYRKVRALDLESKCYLDPGAVKDSAVESGQNEHLFVLTHRQVTEAFIRSSCIIGSAGMDLDRPFSLTPDDTAPTHAQAEAEPVRKHYRWKRRMAPDDPHFSKRTSQHSDHGLFIRLWDLAQHINSIMYHRTGQMQVLNIIWVQL